MEGKSRGVRVADAEWWKVGRSDRYDKLGRGAQRSVEIILDRLVRGTQRNAGHTDADGRACTHSAERTHTTERDSAGS